MKKFLASLVILCALSLSVFAGDIHIPGAPAPTPEDTSASSTVTLALVGIVTAILNR